MTHKDTITSEEMNVRLQKSKIEYSQKSARYMSKQVRNECIVNDFNALVRVTRVFPNLTDVYDIIGKAYNLSRTTVVYTIKNETERARVSSRRARLASM